MLAVLCCAVRAQAGDTLASLQIQDKQAQAAYAQTLQICAAKLAPAQCQRQAKLDFEQTQHRLKLKREAIELQNRRDKQSKLQAEKARNLATGQQGLGADGKPLAREPMSKPEPKQRTAPQPISQPGAVKLPAVKEPMSQPIKRPKGEHSGTLVAQPTPEQRRSNVAQFAGNEQAIAARKLSIEQKKAERLARDNARRAAGFAVDKP